LGKGKRGNPGLSCFQREGERVTIKRGKKERKGKCPLSLLKKKKKEKEGDLLPRQKGPTPGLQRGEGTIFAELQRRAELRKLSRQNTEIEGKREKPSLCLD